MSQYDRYYNLFFIQKLFSQLDYKFRCYTYVSANKDVFKEGKVLIHCHKYKLHLPTRSKVNISHAGEVHTFANVVIKDVLFVPEFKLNLLSVSKITKKLSLYFLLS